MTKTFQITDGDVLLDDRNGRPIEVEGRIKTRQDIDEMLSIETKYDGFGAGLIELVGMIAPLGGFALRAEIQRRIQNAIVVVQSLQNRYQRSKRTRDEMIYGLAGVEVVPVRDNTGALSVTDTSFKVEILTLAGSESLIVTGVI